MQIRVRVRSWTRTTKRNATAASVLVLQLPLRVRLWIEAGTAVLVDPQIGVRLCSGGLGRKLRRVMLGPRMVDSIRTRRVDRDLLIRVWGAGIGCSVMLRPQCPWRICWRKIRLVIAMLTSRLRGVETARRTRARVWIRPKRTSAGWPVHGTR